MARPVALLDANVLYPARLRDLLLRLNLAGLYQARWSDQILDECFRNILEDRPDLSVNRLARTRRNMNAALPDDLNLLHHVDVLLLDGLVEVSLVRTVA